MHIHQDGEELRQECPHFSTEVDETIADITSVWDELNDRSAELEHLLSCGKEDNVFENDINLISEHVDNIEPALVEEKVPSDLATAENFLKEHMVCTCVHMYVIFVTVHAKINHVNANYTQLDIHEYLQF